MNASSIIPFIILGGDSTILRSGNERPAQMVVNYWNHRQCCEVPGPWQSPGAPPRRGAISPEMTS